EIAAHWLVKYAQGTLKLPAKEAIQQDMDFMAEWRKTARPVSSEFSGTCVAPFNFMHLDMLMKVMGLRTSATLLLPYEFFKPINPKDYRILLQASIRKAPQQVPVYQPAEIIQ